MDSNLETTKTQSTKGSAVKVRLNNKDFQEVDQKKLIESSSYFQNILSSKFKDHKSSFVEINYPASTKTFKCAMDFVTSGDLNANDENIFEVYELADYLLMEKLKNQCLDQFASGLDRINVQSKFDFLKTLNFPVGDFKQRASSFVKQNTSGMYFLQREPTFPTRSRLNFYSLESNAFRNVACFYEDDSMELSLHRFNNTIAVCPSSVSSKNKNINMILMDLVSEKLEEAPLSFEGRAVNCSNEHNLFVISLPEKKSVKRTFCVEKFEIDSYTEFRSTTETIEYDLLETYDFCQFHFAQCVDDKMYVFYQTEPHCCETNNNKNYVLIFCTETMKVLKNINIADDGLLNKKYLVGLTLQEVEYGNLYKSFHSRKSNELLVQLDRELSRGNLDFLVFDVEKQLFRVEEDVLQFDGSSSDFQLVNFAAKDDKVYGLFALSELMGLERSGFENPESRDCNDSREFKFCKVWNELRRFDFENDALVEAQAEWVSEERKILYSDYKNAMVVFSIVFVENVELK